MVTRILDKQARFNKWITPIKGVDCKHPVTGEKIVVSTKRFADGGYERYPNGATQAAAGAVTMEPQEETPAPIKAAQDSVNKRTYSKRKTQKQISKKRN